MKRRDALRSLSMAGGASLLSMAKSKKRPSKSRKKYKHLTVFDRALIGQKYKEGMKTGFYNSHSLKRENNVQGAADNFGTLSFANDTVGTNPFDTSFGFANAAIGSFSSYAQASRYVEGT